MKCFSEISDFRAPVEEKMAWNSTQDTRCGFMVFFVLSGVWQAYLQWLAADRSNTSHKLTKGLIRATEAAQDQSTAAMENQDRLCFYLLPVPKKWPKYVRAESRSHARSLEQTKIIKSTFKRCVCQCERGEFHTGTTSPFIKSFYICSKHFLYRPLHYVEKYLY